MVLEILQIKKAADSQIIFKSANLLLNNTYHLLLTTYNSLNTHRIQYLLQRTKFSKR